MKPAVVTWVEENFPGIECGLYEGMYEGAYYAAWGSFFTGQYWATLGLAGISAAARYTAQVRGCNDPPPLPEGGKKCWESNTPAELKILYAPVTEETQPEIGWHRLVRKIHRVDQIRGDDGSWQQICIFEQWDGGDMVSVGPRPVPLGSQWYLATEDCVANEPTPEHEPRQPIGPPITFEDGECTWTITPTDAYVDTGGIWHTYFEVTANDPACGGPYGFWTSDKGPTWVQPRPEPDPYPPDPPTPNPDVDFPDYDPRFDNIDRELEQIKNCACGPNPRPPLAGDWVTTQWKSDEKDDITGTRLRKRFRYRSQSSRDLKQLSDYWRDFTWQAGQVCVIHKNAWWGTPQVWASSAEEGKRVIRFAAGEAGLNPDEVGEWVVTGSRAPRYGMSGTMRLIDKDGFPWVASRDGADWPNLLAR